MTRAPGSGLYRAVATAAEELWAAVLIGHRSAVALWSNEIDNLHASGESGLRSEALRRHDRMVRVENPDSEGQFR